MLHVSNIKTLISIILFLHIQESNQPIQQTAGVAIF